MHKRNNLRQEVKYFESLNSYKSQTNKGRKRLEGKWQN
jgi:hypothetical protein